MKERYASIIEQLKWIPISYRYGLQDISKRLLFILSQLDKNKVKVIDTTFVKYRSFKNGRE